MSPAPRHLRLVRPAPLVALALTAVITACGGPVADGQAVGGPVPTAATSGPAGSGPAGQAATDTSAGATPATTGTTSTAPVATDASGGPLPTRPPWLGSRPLPTQANGAAVPQTTPAELADRRFAPIDTLPPPAGAAFTFTEAPLAGDPLARSSWNEECPVTVEELRYLTIGFWGFDGLPHTGEMIVNAAVVDDVRTVFAALWEARYPIEEMRITSRAEIDAPPLGDGNNTGAFVCRPVVGSISRFSQHAYGLAIDVNPFINPYVKGELVLPELAPAYLDRSNVRPGMITADGPVVAAFDAIGWGWGGRWETLKDYQHFSLNDR